MKRIVAFIAVLGWASMLAADDSVGLSCWIVREAPFEGSVKVSVEDLKLDGFCRRWPDASFKEIRAVSPGCHTTLHTALTPLHSVHAATNSTTIVVEFVAGPMAGCLRCGSVFTRFLSIGSRLSPGVAGRRRSQSSGSPAGLAAPLLGYFPASGTLRGWLQMVVASFSCSGIILSVMSFFGYIVVPVPPLGRDRFPNGPREWWANGMPLRP